MRFLKAEKWWDVLIHIGIIGIIGVLLVLFFFYIYLPSSTNHGETITVPDVVGISYEELDEYLVSRNLKYEITKDSSYNPDYPPNSVLQQFPKPNSKVKENRKIYITLNTSSPPLVKMPNLVDVSLKMAQMVLNSYDLKLGKITYKPDLALNAVLEQRYDGDEINEGDQIPKGSQIDLIVGDGLGNQLLEAPNLIEQDEESARIAIIGSGLTIGNVTYQNSNEAVITIEESDTTYYETVWVDIGSVVRQSPIPGTVVRLQREINLWIYRPDSLNLNPSILDQ